MDGLNGLPSVGLICDLSEVTHDGLLASSNEI